VSEQPRISRRALLYGGAATVCAAAGGAVVWSRGERGLRAAAFVGRADSYEDGARLEALVLDGLRELGVDRAALRGKRVLLKPNLVEPSREAPHINTSPAVVRAVAQALRRFDCREVAVGEGPGHVRDTDLVLEESGLGPVLAEDRIPFHDLNHDEVQPVANRMGFTGLEHLYLPRALRRFDLVVSLPKMKTHHWAGVTLSMKNLFGLLPGIVYGWPKNVLHRKGIARSILDVSATVRPGLAIVDGIVGMEGDGPIMGRPRPSGLLVMGRNPAAVDATSCRLMGFEPRRIEYLAVASGRLGPIRSEHIEQRGEALSGLVQRFELLDHPSLKRFREG
jgi:uncharacterized protein (DUF362 family)